MRRRWIVGAAIAIVVATVAIAGCSTAPPEGTVAHLHSADDGEGVFVGQFGSDVPVEAVVDVRVLGALVGMTWCADISVFDRPPTWFPSLDEVGHVRACTFVPVAVGDATVVIGPFPPGWEQSLGGSLEGMWFWADISVEVPPGGTLTPAGIRGVRLADAVAVPACLGRPGVIYLC